MTAATTSIRLAATPRMSRPAEAMLPAVVVALLGFSFQLTQGMTLGLTPAYLLPIAAAWWAQRAGSRVAVVFALLYLVPDLAWRVVDVVTVYYGFADTGCMLAAGVALAFARDWRAESLCAVVPPGRRWLLAGSVVLWVFAASDGGSWADHSAGVSVSVDVLAIPALAGIAIAVDWRGALASIGSRRSRTALALLALAGLSLSLRVGVGVGPFNVGLGSARASALLPALCFVTVLCGWASWRFMLMLVAAAAAGLQALTLLVGSLSQWLALAHATAVPATLFAQACAAALMGGVLRGLRGPHAMAGAPLGLSLCRGDLLMLAAAVLLIVLLPALDQGRFVFRGTAVWVFAGVSLIAGLALGGRAVAATPLAILAGVTGLCLLVDPQQNFESVRFELPTLLAVSTCYALLGLLWLRRVRMDEFRSRRSDGALATLDLSDVARSVQDIDHAATLRAFWALLVPAFALAQFFGFGIAIDLGNELFDDAQLSWLWLAVAGALLALWPAMFVLADWADRQDSLRALSGLTAMFLALAGTTLLAIAPGLALPALLESAPDAAAFAVGGLLVACLPAIAWWSRASSVAARRGALLAGGMALLALAAAAIAAGLALPAGQRLEGMAQILALAAVLAVTTAGWLRAIRIRLVLCEDRPRHLLYGALPPGHFWVRMAALLGLPSNLWKARAFSEPATWAFLLSRPIVYAGAMLANTSLLFAAGVVAMGHALFHGAKRLAARAVWRPQDEADSRAPILFLRSFEDDQFDFQRPFWQVRLRWFDLWSFRRNVDEAMVDEIAQYGPVVALGRPGETDTPFGALRHYSSHDEWQRIVVQTARRARAIVLVAGRTPGLRWEFETLRAEGLLGRTLLLLHPDPARVASNAQAIEWLLGAESLAGPGVGARLDRAVAVLPSAHGPRLLTADRPSAAAYLLALRAHLQRIDPKRLTGSQA